jgi:hypothetical protein
MQVIRAVLVLLVCAAASVAHAQTRDSYGPIGQRVREFASAINSGNPEEMTRLVRSSFGENMQQVPAPTHIAVLMSYWDTSRGLELRELEACVAGTFPLSRRALVDRRHRATEKRAGPCCSNVALTFWLSTAFGRIQWKQFSWIQLVVGGGWRSVDATGRDLPDL